MSRARTPACTCAHGSWQSSTGRTQRRQASMDGGAPHMWERRTKGHSVAGPGRPPASHCAGGLAQGSPGSALGACAACRATSSPLHLSWICFTVSVAACSSPAGRWVSVESSIRKRGCRVRSFGGSPCERQRALRTVTAVPHRSPPPPGGRPMHSALGLPVRLLTATVSQRVGADRTPRRQRST